MTILAYIFIITSLFENEGLYFNQERNYATLGLLLPTGECIYISSFLVSLKYGGTCR